MLADEGRVFVKRLFYLVSLCLLAAAVLSAPALAQTGGGDLDCGDFFTQESAQATLDEVAGDYYGLDADGDGIACETLPSGQAEDGTLQPGTNLTAEEQYTMNHPANQGNLFITKKGLVTFGQGTPASQTSTESTVMELPDTGGASLLLPAGVLLLGSGIVSLRILQRR